MPAKRVSIRTKLELLHLKFSKEGFTMDITSLTLSRKERERIFIGDNIIVEVVEAGWGKARLRITAPRDVIITREELLNKQEATKYEG
jgi:carbon storage regulator CsrA